MRSFAFTKAAALAAALLTVSCVTRKERETAGPVPRIDQILPGKVMAGVPFQVQPDGNSAISVTGANLSAGSRIRINGMPVVTAYGDGSALSGLVPKELFAEPGMYPLSVESASGDMSNTVPFIVLPRTGPQPVIKQVFPATAEAGKPFNEQPGGKSAVGITGEHFLPGAVIEINGEPQATNFIDTDRIAALVAPKFLSRAASLRITVLNIDGKRSAPGELILTAPK